MAIHNRRIKNTEITFGDDNDFQCQVQSWTLANNSSDPERIYTQCPDGVDFEEVDDEWALELTFFSDWRSAGVSDYLIANDGENVAFTLVHHSGVEGEEVTWTGTVRIKAPSVGGEVRTTEMTEVTLQILGKPVYTRTMDDESSSSGGA